MVGFVPSHMLPRKRPISLDPFLEPLISDIEGGFINGIEVNYKLATCGKAAGMTTIRHLMACVRLESLLKWGKVDVDNANQIACMFLKHATTIIPTLEEKHVIQQKTRMSEITWTY